MPTAFFVITAITLKKMGIITSFPGVILYALIVGTIGGMFIPIRKS